MFLSFDGQELCLWASHNDKKPVIIISKLDITATYLKLGKPTQPYSNTVVIEDIFDLNVHTNGHEMISFRFTDASSRVRWNETLMYALRGYTSFKAMAGSETGSVSSNDDVYGRVVDDGEDIHIPGRSRISMIAMNAQMLSNPSLERYPAKILHIDEPDFGSIRAQGRVRRRASRLMDELAIQSLTAEVAQNMPNIDDKNEEDSDSNSDSTSNSKDDADDSDED